MEPILIGLIVMGLLARHATNLRTRTYLRIEPIAHEPTRMEQLVIDALRSEYARLLADEAHHEALHARASDPSTRTRVETDLHYIRAQQGNVLRDLTLRGCAPTSAL